ncbi:MAG: dihydroorotase [Synergistales bacterium]|nr:dihydroorotase [Synergistales bacterium]
MLLQKVYLFDGRTVTDETVDIHVRDGKVAAIGKELDAPRGEERVDLQGMLVAPGFIDIHGHFRDPGQTWREDLLSGSRAAAAGGYVTAVAMPNTDPPLDAQVQVEYVAGKRYPENGAVVRPAGAVTKGRAGVELTEMARMVESGAVLFTDDGSPVRTHHLMRTALLYARDLGVRIMEHPEEPELTRDGEVNEGRCSAISGMKGFPHSGETLGVIRSLELSRETGVPIHLTHVSLGRALEMIRRAKKEGVAVTCDVTPHHLVLSEEDVLESHFNAAYKVNPPLRSEADVRALWEGIADGTVDAIGTDHAPYRVEEKDVPFQDAPFGIASYECAVAAVLDAWQRNPRGVALHQLLARWSAGPAGILGEYGRAFGAVEEGKPATLTVLDLHRSRTVDTRQWYSKAAITPYAGRSLQGWPVAAILEGKTLSGCGIAGLEAGR